VEGPYDSRPETYQHIQRVRYYVGLAVDNLRSRAANHDQSKLVDPELPHWDEATPKLQTLTYGTEEYKQSLRDLKPAVDHHYSVNDHHPEFYEDGIRGMSLMALLEMVCDWKAASERMGKKRSFEEGIVHNQERFGYSDELADILRNTARELNFG
jgi:hypothetical protein